MRKFDQKTLIIAGVQVVILLLAYFGVWGYTLVVTGLIGILLQLFLQLRFTGWISAITYPVTYWISALCDNPANGNLYVYWVFSYVGIIIVAFTVDLIRKMKAWC